MQPNSNFPANQEDNENDQNNENHPDNKNTCSMSTIEKHFNI